MCVCTNVKQFKTGSVYSYMQFSVYRLSSQRKAVSRWRWPRHRHHQAQSRAGMLPETDRRRSPPTQQPAAPAHTAQTRAPLRECSSSSSSSKQPQNTASVLTASMGASSRPSIKVEFVLPRSVTSTSRAPPATRSMQWCDDTVGTAMTMSAGGARPTCTHRWEGEGAREGACVSGTLPPQWCVPRGGGTLRAPCQPPAGGRTHLQQAVGQLDGTGQRDGLLQVVGAAIAHGREHQARGDQQSPGASRSSSSGNSTAGPPWQRSRGAEVGASACSTGSHSREEEGGGGSDGSLPNDAAMHYCAVILLALKENSMR